VLTCQGRSFAARVAGSVLRAVGLPELITHTLEEYERKALQLVQEPGALQQLRERLARHRNTHPLFDTARFTRNLESAFLTMHQRALRGEAPMSFNVPPGA
jgi:protein O-GlcNAc transferase